MSHKLAKSAFLTVFLFSPSSSLSDSETDHANIEAPVRVLDDVDPSHLTHEVGCGVKSNASRHLFVPRYSVTGIDQNDRLLLFGSKEVRPHPQFD